MMYVQHNGNGGWIEPTHPTTLEGIMESLIKADVIISDIDCTIAPYSKLGAVYSRLGRWQSLGAFLRNIDRRVGISRRYTSKYSKQRLFPEVLEFYKTLSKFNLDQKKIFVTRNAGRVAEAYQEALNFNDAFPREFDKRKAIDKIIERYPNARNFIIMGNDASDQEMLNHLRSKKSEGYNVKGIYVATSHYRVDWNMNFDANMGRHYGALRRACLEYLSGSLH